MNRVCVVGSFMMDLIARAPRRPLPGETLVGTSFEVVPGGKGYNQAVAAGRFGAEVSFVGMLGEDSYGDEFIEDLRRNDIDCSFVFRNAEQGTGVALPVVEESGENSIIIVPRANHALAGADIDRAADVIARADVLLLQLEVSLEAVIRAAEIARAHSTTVVLNPAPYAPIPAELLDRVDILVPNEGEAKSFFGGQTVEETVMALTRHWDRRAVVTLGSRGIAIIDGVVASVAAHGVTPVDTIGAGDTFCGVLGASLALGSDLRTAAKYANAAAAIAVTRRGGSTSSPTRDEVTAFLRGA